MHLSTNLKLLFSDLRAQKLRTLLTIFGIMWGTMSVILLLAFGTGVEKQNIKNMAGIGDGVVILWGGKTGMPFNGFNKGRDIRLKYEDAQLLRREIPEIGLISPEYSTYNARVRGPENVDQTNITGIIPEYEDIRNIFVQAGGRFITDHDMQNNVRAAVIGDKICKFLFGSTENIVGETVEINKIPFVIVGITQKKVQNSNYNTRDENRVFIPATTFNAIFGHKYVANIVYKPVSPLFSESIESRVYETLGKKYIFNPADEDALWIWDTAEFQQIFVAFMLGFKIFLGIIGSFTLTVGGVGVANIMYVVVRERTKEIGIKRAVGARRRNILFQFIFETFIIVTIGAVIGFAMAAGLVEILQMLPEEMVEAVGTPQLSTSVAIISIILLGLVALFAGYFPARRASVIDPVDALRT
ncbi:MAG: ABC transporter permease [Calditrichaeota bacterium]|nr:MAG: ABC transporter permease [Calditrichota bacterium]